MIAKSMKGNSAGEIKSAFHKALSDGYQPTLAFVFISVKQNRDELIEVLDAQGITIFGATTAGEFIDGEIEEGSIAVLLLDMDSSHFKVILRETQGNHTNETAAHIAEEAIKTFANPGFIIASGGIPTDGATIIHGIQEKLGTDASIYGGMAGDDHTGNGTFVFDNNHETGNGLIALIIDEDKVAVTGFATSGWKPVGTIRTVTKSEGFTVDTIDNEPALDMMIKYLGLSIDVDSPDELSFVSDVISPIQLFRDDAPSVLSEIRAVNLKKRSVMFAGAVPEGTKFRFSLPPDWDIINKIKSDCNIIKRKEQPEAEAIIIFSCASRLFSLGPMISKEIEEIKNTWGCPLAGFFCYGEIGKYLGGETEFHNNTCSIVILQEK